MHCLVYVLDSSCMASAALATHSLIIQKAWQTGSAGPAGPARCVLERSTAWATAFLYAQAQLEALETTYGVQPSSTEAALPIWTAMLAQSGLLSEAHQE